MSGMIVAPQPTAVEEGAKILMQGGNAVDAAVTAAFVQFVLDPHSCSAGGYMIVNYHPGTARGASQSVLLDGPALAGSRVAPTMWEDIVIGPNPDGWGYFLEGKVNDLGYQAVCTPGAIKGLAEMVDRWGTMSWSDVLQPATRVAEEGFRVGAHLATRWKTPAGHPELAAALDAIQSTPEARRIYLKENGTPYQAGELLKNPGYAQTFRRLAEAGPEDFYQGELASRISSDMEANGGFITADDLSSYQLREPPPTRGSYRDHEVTSSQPPHGGPTLVAILNILDQYDLRSLGHNSPDYIHLVSMAMKAAFCDRNRWLADPEFVDVPLEQMLSKNRSRHWKDVIDSGTPIEGARGSGGPPDTTHVTVVDGRGNCVSLTHSCGSGSGGVITPGLGFMYNNSMINFDPHAGHVNSIEARKGRTTGMTPTIVYKDGRPRLVLGAPGATRIVTSVLQVILNVVDFDMSISDAVLAPRFDCQEHQIWCQARIPEFICAEVRTRHPIERLPDSHGGLAFVHAIHIDPDSESLTGGADTGADGMALLVT